MDRKSVQGGIWLIGIGIMLLTGFWWPGILILIGLSMLASVLIPDEAKVKVEAPAQNLPGDETSALVGDADAIPPALGEGYLPVAQAQTHSTALLPVQCPMCGGPVLDLQSELEWTGFQSACCPWCATNLPLPEPEV